VCLYVCVLSLIALVCGVMSLGGLNWGECGVGGWACGLAIRVPRKISDCVCTKLELMGLVFVCCIHWFLCVASIDQSCKTLPIKHDRQLV